MPVFYVARIIRYSAVEDVLQRVLPQEKVADLTHLQRVLAGQPQLPQVLDCVDIPLAVLELAHNLGVADAAALEQLNDFAFVLFYKSYYSLPIIFRDVLCLIFWVFLLELRSLLEFALPLRIGLLVLI